MSIIPGIEIAAPERTETSSGSDGSPKRFPALLLERRDVLADLVVEPVRHLLAVGHVGAARVGRDREAGRHGHAERRHLREPDALAAEQLPSAGRLLVEVVDVAHGVILAQDVHARMTTAVAAARRTPACEDMPMSGHVVAMGGGGFLRRSASPLDELLLGLTGERRPHVVFLPTATGDSRPGDGGCSRPACGARDCTRDVVDDLRRPGPPRGARRSRRRRLVAGGNTANMLAVWRVHGIDRALREAWERGAALGGVSAGANCWFEACVTDSFSAELDGLDDGLGLPRGSFCPHFDGEERRRPVYTRLVADGFPAGIACDDGAAAVYRGHGARRGRRRPRRRARLPRLGRRRGADRRPACCVRKVSVTASASGSGKTTVGARARPHGSTCRSSSSTRSCTGRTGPRRRTTSCAACSSRSSPATAG